MDKYGIILKKLFNRTSKKGNNHSYLLRTMYHLLDKKGTLWVPRRFCI
jgi:hypothetical protein